jgi:hypothetical protein
MRAHRLEIVAGMCLTICAAASMAAEPATASSPAPAVPAAVPYLPSMGDLMTMAVQPRHTKLGLAGRAGNWPYATYELSELRNAFGRIARTIPLYNKTTDTAESIAAMTQAPLQAVEVAVKAQDVKAFTAAYAALTQACNACHVTQSHAPVVVKVPAASPYPDQEFQPPK